MRSTLHHEFPLPWTVQERSSCFVVHDKTSQPLAYIHFEDKSGRLSPINQLTRDEARRIAENIAKLPELLRWTLTSLMSAIGGKADIGRTCRHVRF
jgi:hypothetical protein